MLTQIENNHFASEVETLDQELEAVKLFENKRWGIAPKCPYCGSASLSKRRNDLRFKCLTCKKSGSVTVNTHLHDTRLPLHIWLKAFTHAANEKKVPAPSYLQKDLNISYKSALRMHNKINELLQRVDPVLQGNLLEALLNNAMQQPVHHYEQEAALASV